MSESNGIEKLIRPELAIFDGYSAREAPEILEDKVEVPVAEILKLDANENPYGCSPTVNRALAEYPEYNIYPDTGQTEIRKLLAGYTGIEPEYIVADSGSNRLIDLILRLLIRPGDEVINCIPTFEMFRFSTTVCGGTVIEVRRDGDFNIDVGAVKAAITKKIKMIFLANPNNPTGNLIPQKDILEILDTGVPVMVDEAYYEFSGETVIPFARRYQNLMILRTFSKWAGLAGLRIGYGIFPPRIVDHLMEINVPYSVNVASQTAVKESLKDQDYLLANVKLLINERERMFGELKKLEFLKPFPSRANFILCSVLSGNASDIQQILKRKGILVRYFNRPLLQNSVRFSVGKPEHTDALIKALKEAWEEING
ncbi:histidinol-phosphate transaminase [Chloroflexota bacterium]